MDRRIAPRRDYAYSVIVSAWNEAGNLGELLNRLPAFGTSREVVFVEGRSTDGTWEIIATEIQKRPGENLLALRQRGNGKGQAVRQAIDSCRGELIFILDADLSVDPEALNGLYQIMQRESADFINGNRFARPMELGAMKPLNWLGNKVFAQLMIFLLGQRFSDTLCGTKVFFREDFLLDQNPVARMDPFGDYGLLIGASLCNLRIRESPLDYRARRYGRTNIQRWRGGWLLLRILLAALVPTKFPPCNPIQRQDAR